MRYLRILTGTIGLGLALFAAPLAHASTVSVTGGNKVKVTGSNNETNSFTVAYTLATDIYTVVDPGSTINPSGTCLVVDTHTVTCPGAGIKTVEVDSGNRNDTVVLDRLTIPTAVAGDLDGGSGDDFIAGGKGVDNVKGDSGSDLLDGRDGADDMNGGSGTDRVVYSDRITPVQVSIGSGNGNDGNEVDQTGAGRDTVRGDVETVFGGAAGNSLVGDSSSETLVGGPGADTLVGNNGGDTLLGSAGNDSIFGGNGDDALFGDFGADLLLGGPNGDRLAGGPDDDRLWGKKGVDVLLGKSGNDRINAKDGARDFKINCGPGKKGLESAKRDKRLDPRPKSC